MVLYLFALSDTVEPWPHYKDTIYIVVLSLLPIIMTLHLFIETTVVVYLVMEGAA